MTVTGSTFEAPTPYVGLPARLGVLLSGRGSNFVALAEACRQSLLPASVALVISDRPDAAGLLKAHAMGIPAAAVDRKLYKARADHEERVVALLEEAGVSLVCLAGYMRILSSAFVDRFRLRLLNIHPSLLPSFPGKEAQAQALAYGARVTGVTVHFVDAGMDTGPILAQEAMPVEPSDTVSTLSARLLELEHRVYRRAVGDVLQGGWALNGRSVSFPPSI